ncbi:hypothetical protein [Oceanobacillus timonensis]|uniref:hypothetical protein n=1 Tax=Oceanobacillus timonensis TaxID=1926285 RepID=UPI0009BC2F02|nr:hypothetical protein [Oceanobacillus timonensis]
MNKFIIGSQNTYGEEKEKLGIIDKNSFNKFLEDLEYIDADRINAGMVGGNHCTKIANTLRCFEISFDNRYSDILYINNLSIINNSVFNGEKTDLEILLWVSKEMAEGIAEILDENIRYGGFYDDNFLKNTRDFLLQTYISCVNYHLVK